MTEELGGYRRALDGFGEMLSQVPDERWESPSPCTEWSARDVAGHMIGGQHMILALATGAQPPEINTDSRRFAGADPVESWHAAHKKCAAVLTGTALRRPIPFGRLGDVPLRDFLGGYIMEFVIHTWDLAQAADLPTRSDPDLVHHAFATARVIAPFLRSAGRLGPPRPAPQRADELTRLLAYLGRRP
jgi:uncharacterized protein (TIGR03086 family)